MTESDELRRLADSVGDKLVDSVIIGHQSSEGLLILKGARTDGDKWRIQVITISGVMSISTRVPSRQLRRYGANALRFLDEEEFIARVGTWQDPLNQALGIQMLLYSGRTIEAVGNLSVEIIDGEMAEKTYNVPNEVALPKPSVQIGHKASAPIPTPVEEKEEIESKTEVANIPIQDLPKDQTTPLEEHEYAVAEAHAKITDEIDRDGQREWMKAHQELSEEMAEAENDDEEPRIDEKLTDTLDSKSNQEKFWADPSAPMDQGFKEVEEEDIIQAIDRELEEVERKVKVQFGKNGERPQVPLRPEDLDRLTNQLEDSGQDDQN